MNKFQQIFYYYAHALACTLLLRCVRVLIFNILKYIKYSFILHT